MTDRILDLSQSGAHLHLRHENLVVDREEMESQTIPLSDLSVLVVSHPQVTFSKALVAAMAARGCAFLVCDEMHLPSGMLLPLQTNSIQTERLAAQIRAALPTKKRLWKQLVREKIRAQGRMLSAHYGTDSGVGLMAKRVRSGDPENIEAQAARRYWGRFLGEKSFRRDWREEGPNSLLNYGYAILRAVVARAVSATGLHPSIGLHHHNRYNAFCLADDIMEPYRPLVDDRVLSLIREHGESIDLTQEVKLNLLACLAGHMTSNQESRSLFDWMSRTANSLNAVFAEERKDLFLPRFSPSFDTRSLED